MLSQAAQAAQAAQAIEPVAWTFMLVAIRITGVVLALPMLAGEVAPAQIRGGLVIVLSGVAVSVLPLASPTSATPVAFILEFLLGFGLGLIVRLAVTAAQVATELAGGQLGFGFARLVDPVSNEPANPLTHIVTAALGVLVFATNAHLEIVRGIVESLRAFAPGAGLGLSNLPGALLQLGEAMFTSGLRIAAPLIAVGLATQVAFGLLTRVAPQMQLWGIGFLVTIGVGLIALAFFAPVLMGECEALLRGGVDQFTSAVMGGA